MKTMNFIMGMMPSAVEGTSKTVEMNSAAWYAIGGLIAICLLAYLIYALLKPENF